VSELGLTPSRSVLTIRADGSTKSKLNRVQFEIRSQGAWSGSGGCHMTVFLRARFGLVLRVDHERWGQTEGDLRDLALSAPHPRSRERFLAMHEIARGRCASEVAERTGRHPQTVMGWLHLYNEGGPEAVQYRRTGGRPPFAQRSKPRSVRRSTLPSETRLGPP